MPYKPGRKVRVGRPIRIDEDEMCRRARGRSPGQVLRRSVVATAAPGAYSMIAAPHGTARVPPVTGPARRSRGSSHPLGSVRLPPASQPHSTAPPSPSRCGKRYETCLCVSGETKSSRESPRRRIYLSCGPLRRIGHREPSRPRPARRAAAPGYARRCGRPTSPDR